MSQDNVDMVRALWESFKGVDCAAIDWDGEPIRAMAEALWSPEIELRWARSNPEARVYRGRNAVIQAFREWVEPFSEYYVEPLDFIGVDDRVIVPQRQWGAGSTSGAPVEVEVTYVYEVRDDRITKIDEYDTLEEAREAAELAE